MCAQPALAGILWAGLAMAAGKWAVVPQGAYRPLFAPGELNSKKVSAQPANPFIEVETFKMATAPVTNADYLLFVKKHPEWRRDRVKAVFADRRE